MKRAILRLIYLSFRREFEDLLVEDLIGIIPSDVREPAISFLRSGKKQLTRWLMFNAYHLQRRSVTDKRNAEQFHGMLIFTKFLMSMVNDGASDAMEAEPVFSVPEQKKDPSAGLSDFMEGFKSKKLDTK